MCHYMQPENFLLSKRTDDATLKLADFGLSAWFKPGQKFSHIVGSAYYVAPEVELLSCLVNMHYKSWHNWLRTSRRSSLAALPCSQSMSGRPELAVHT